jgi:hypothetical protein
MLYCFTQQQREVNMLNQIPYAFVAVERCGVICGADREWRQHIPVLPGEFVDEVLDQVRTTVSPYEEVWAKVVWVQGAEAVVGYLNYTLDG